MDVFAQKDMMPIAPYNEIIQQIMPTNGCPVLILNGIRTLDNRQMLTIADMPPNAKQSGCPGATALLNNRLTQTIFYFFELNVPVSRSTFRNTA